MAYGIMIESRIAATNVDAYNKSAVSSTSAFDGGNLVVLAAPSAQGEERWTATVPATGSLTGLWMAYNPSEHLTAVNGKYFAGLSADPRDYTNIQGRTFSVFKPQVGDEIEVTADAVSGSSIAAGDVMEGADGSTKLTKVGSHTAGNTAFKVVWKGVSPFPQAGIGMESATIYRLVCIEA